MNDNVDNIWSGADILARRDKEESKESKKIETI